MNKATLLKLRRTAKKRKPYFVVKESHFIDRVKARWRLPRGRHSAARQRYRGRPAQPHPGYGSPQEVRGLSREGFIPVQVHTEKELLTLKPGVEAAVISQSVGVKRKLALLNLAQEKKIAVLYHGRIKDISVLLAKIKDDVALQQKERKSRREAKVKKRAEQRKKSEEKQKKKAEAPKKEKAEEQKLSLEKSVKSPEDKSNEAKAEKSDQTKKVDERRDA